MNDEYISYYDYVRMMKSIGIRRFVINEKSDNVLRFQVLPMLGLIDTFRRIGRDNLLGNYCFLAMDLNNMGKNHCRARELKFVDDRSQRGLLYKHNVILKKMRKGRALKL